MDCASVLVYMFNSKKDMNSNSIFFSSYLSYGFMPAWEFLTCMGVFLVILTHGGVFWAAFDLWGSLQWCMIRWGKSSFHDSWGGYLGNFRLTGKSLMMLRKNLGNFWLTGKHLMMYNPLGKDSFLFLFFWWLIRELVGGSNSRGSFLGDF